MRLGDLDALKEKLSGEDYQTWTHEYGYAIPTEWVMNAIDNAPTVEPCYQTTSCLDCKNYDKETHNCPRYCEVIKEAIKSRPQGEWIKVKEDRMSIDMSGEIVTGYKCSICGRYIVTLPSKLADYPFCHCGADMRGDEK